MIGFVVTSVMSYIVLNLEVMSTSSMSGLPFDVESDSELLHIPSKHSVNSPFLTSRFSQISPDSPS